MATFQDCSESVKMIKMRGPGWGRSWQDLGESANDLLRIPEDKWQKGSP